MKRLSIICMMYIFTQIHVKTLTPSNTPIPLRTVGAEIFTMYD